MNSITAILNLKTKLLKYFFKKKVPASFYTQEAAVSTYWNRQFHTLKPAVSCVGTGSFNRWN